MRYIDSGGRDPDQTLGRWLLDLIDHAELTAGLRIQSGFFSASALGFLQPIVRAVDEACGAIHVVVGSNKGETRRQDLQILLELLGEPRPGKRVGIVSYENAFYHPKTIHVTRNDDSQAAYVGSANLTGSGVRSLHAEAGLILDTRDGDPLGPMSDIAAAVDRWFGATPGGLHLVESRDDLDALEADGIIGARRRTQPGGASSTATRSGSRATLAPLIKPPPFALSAGAPIGADNGDSAPTPSETSDGELVASYWKRLTASDAQRKPSGNQRGSVTLTGREAGVETQTYFRFDFFSGVDWTSEKTRTGEVLEAARIPMSISIDGEDLGTLVMPVTYAPNREQDQNNYTTLLHIGPLADLVAHVDLTGRNLTIGRLSTGTFRLSIE